MWTHAAVSEAEVEQLRDEVKAFKSHDATVCSTAKHFVRVKSKT